MYDINTKNVKKGINFYLIFLLLGILFFVMFIIFFITNFIHIKKMDSSIMSNRVEVNSYIDDEGTTMYRGMYYYNVDGKTYTCTSSSASSISPSTENKTIYYESKNPTNCTTSKSFNYILLVFIILPIVFIIIGIKNISKVNKRIKQINELNTKGKLVKNLPYTLVNSGMTVNNVQIKKPIVEYTLPSGTTITLEGDARLDRKLADSDGLVDLVIDLNNPDNYFIDFEINRLSGNLEEDYYNNPNNNQNNSNINNNTN